MKIITLFVMPFLLFSSEIHAQKVMEKTWNSKAFRKIELISEDVSNVTFSTTNTEIIKVVTKVEGEHYESILLETVEDNGILSLKPRFRPYFENKNDKLAAHKVMAIELAIEVPPNMELYIQSESSSVTIYGQYENVLVGLRDGHCILQQFSGNADLQTRSGDIYVAAHPGTMAKAQSQYGVVQNDLIRGRNYKIKAQSVNGLITLVKSQE